MNPRGKFSPRAIFPFNLLKEKMMKVTFHTSCLTLLGGMENWVVALSEKAMHAWELRPQGETTTRFLFRVPSKAGKQYHFFKVEPHRVGHMLNVRA